MMDLDPEWLYTVPAQGAADDPARLSREDRKKYAYLKPPPTAEEYLLTRSSRNPAVAVLRLRVERQGLDIPRPYVAPVEEPQQRLYFIQCGDGPIKIGIAENVKTRLCGLQVAHFEGLRLLGTIPGSLAIERQWHDRFDEHNVRGEWFRPVPALLAAIAEALAPHP